MRSISWIVLAALACGCGDAVELDEGEQLGQDEQGLGATFSTTWSYGVNVSNRQNCTKAAGCGLFIGMLPSRGPGKGALRFKMNGSEGTFPMNWQSETRRAFDDMKFFMTIPGVTDWQFLPVTGSETADVNVTVGACGGDVQSDNINSFVCTQFFGAVDVTDNLPGTYRRYTSMLITIDQNKILQRVVAIGSGVNFHQLQEHGLHAAVATAVGLGLIGPTGSAFWEEQQVDNQGLTTDSRFNFSNYKTGDICRARSYRANSLGDFSQSAGSCPD